MIILTEKGKQIRGDAIIRAVLRSDLAPVPVTLEADFRTDSELDPNLVEGKILTVGDTAMKIVKSETKIQGAVQGDRATATRSITALLDACHAISFIRSRAIIKENATLSGIYRAAGATLRAIEADYAIPRFTCPIGDVPSWHIARALQEAGGIVRWRAGKLAFLRLLDLPRQTPVITLSNSQTDDLQSGFMERHEVPSFFSLDASGGFVQGNRIKVRSVQFAPHANTMQLFNMTRCLIRTKAHKIAFSGQLAAGDAVQYPGVKNPLTIITAAHVWESGTDGTGINQYTRLWVGEVEG